MLKLLFIIAVIILIYKYLIVTVDVRDEINRLKREKNKIRLDHADIVTSHLCNKRCKYCIDKFVRSSPDIIKLSTVKKFLDGLQKYGVHSDFEVLLLGGEPTILSTKHLIDIANEIKEHGFKSIISTNGVLRDKIKILLNYYDWIQITVSNQKELDYWQNYGVKGINIKFAGDENMTIKEFNWFIDSSTAFERRSISMYFKPDFEELCKDQEVWKILDSLEWDVSGSYKYTYYKGVRIKRCIPGVTNVALEPTVPKVYPNGNYNRTWNNEELDNYLRL